MAFGGTARAMDTNALAIGTGSTAGAASSMALGDTANATAANATAIGAHSTAGFANSTAIGTGATTTAANQIAVGTATNTYRMAGVASAASLAAQTGPTKFVTTDAAGNLAASSFSAPDISGLQSGLSTLQGQVASLQGQIGANLTEARRGIAAAVATASAPMPSAPGKTTWQVRGSTFQSEAGFGFGFAHRLYTGLPLSIVGGYGNGGGTQHTAYVGMGGEF
jgi:autotransporter adhesin